MRAITLLYHDVVDTDQFQTSGFSGADADIYKMDLPYFKEHIRALAETVKEKPILVSELLAKKVSGRPFMVTFDDGGVTAYTNIAGVLEQQGWRAHFFVATNYISTPGFLRREEIADLHQRGHLIGAHSCSHPAQMADCSWDELLEEWRRSVETLQDIISMPVRTGSVPSGSYSKKVAQAAAAVGIQALFTSEPLTRCHWVAGCLVLGRYTIWRTMSPKLSVGYASGKTLPRFKQWVYWNTKKITKRIGGRAYLTVRKWILEKAR